MGTKNNPGPRDYYANALPDEPMFILLARDPVAPQVIASWVSLRGVRGLNTLQELDEAAAVADAMRTWRAANDGAWRRAPAPPAPAEPAWQFYWGFGTDPETLNGPFATRGAAMADALRGVAENGEPGVAFTVCEGRRADLTDDIFDSDAVLDAFVEWNDNAIDSYSEGIEATAEQKDDLSRSLRDTFAAWRARHKLDCDRTIETRNPEVATWTMQEAASSC